jgi:hypothetical protein
VNEKLLPRIPTVGIVQKSPSTPSQLSHKHHHHGGAISPSYGIDSSVVYRFFTPPLAGIGKLPALAGQYFSIGITVGILTVRFGGNTFEDFAGTLFLKIWREFLLSLKGGQSVQKGAEAPPFLWEKGAPANFKIPKILTKFSFGIGMVNTEKIPKGSYQNTKSVYNSNSSRFCGSPCSLL